MQLHSDNLLQGGKYKIEKILGQGGFGITYLAKQKVTIKGGIGEIETEFDVAIKEFFMKDLCNRDENSSYISIPSIGSKQMVDRFRHKFVKEAQNISTLKHSNIIKVLDIFEENGTAYYVMEYLKEGSLSDYVNERGALSEIEALFYIRQIASALDYIHKNSINHLDIKPGNILRKNNSEVVLIDFGISKRYDNAGGQTSTVPVGITPGYTPMEQYDQGGVATLCPATDIYALGATLYKLITGNTPPVANIVHEDGLTEFPDHISETTKNAIISAMKPSRKQRPQNIAEFIALLDRNESSKAATEEIAEKDDFDYDDLIIDATEASSYNENPNNFEETQIDCDEKDIPTITKEEEDRIIKLKNKRIKSYIPKGIKIVGLRIVPIGILIGIIVMLIIEHRFTINSVEVIGAGVFFGVWLVLIIAVVVVIIGATPIRTFSKKDYEAMGNPNRLVIPNYFTNIKSNAFLANVNLTAIVIPNSIRTIDNHTLPGYNNLTIFISPTSPVYKKLKYMRGNKVVEINNNNNSKKICNYILTTFFKGVNTKSKKY